MKYFLYIESKRHYVGKEGMYIIVAESYNHHGENGRKRIWQGSSRDETRVMMDIMGLEMTGKIQDLGFCFDRPEGVNMFIAIKKVELRQKQ